MPRVYRDPATTGDTIIRPELTRADCAFLNDALALSGSLDRFVDELRPPVGPSGVGSANRRMEPPPDTSWVTFDLVGP